jgi:hypothetical protein
MTMYAAEVRSLIPQLIGAVRSLAKKNPVASRPPEQLSLLSGEVAFPQQRITSRTVLTISFEGGQVYFNTFCDHRRERGDCRLIA